MESLGDPGHYMPDEARLAEIRARIGEYNAERPSIRRRAYLQAALYMGAYAAVVLSIFYLMRHSGSKNSLLGWIFAGAAMCGWWIWDFAWKPVKDHQLSLRYRLFPVIFGFIGDMRYSHGHAPGFLDDIRRIKLVQFTHSENDDLVSGMHDGLGFEMLEARLTIGSGKNRTSVFKGLIFRFSLKTEFPGLLAAAKRGNRFQEWLHDLFGHHSDTIASGDWDIDRTHEIHTDNHAAAKPLVEGPLVSALTYLRREWWAGEARIALRGRECFLLLPSDRDYFALPDIGRDVDYEADIEPMIRDMVVLLAAAHLISRMN